MAEVLAHLSDGSTLQTSWNSALADATQHFKQLLTAQSSRSWKHLTPSTGTPSANTPSTSSKNFPFGRLGTGSRNRNSVTPSDVQLHRRTNKSGDVFRGTLEVPLSDDVREALSIESIRAVLETPEVRPSWDKLVAEASTLDVLDVSTRVVQTRYKLGWPASPRDSITIAKVFNDDKNVVLITTSPPRSPTEPAYLRASPPYVRAHVNLLAYCVQFISEPSQMPASPSGGSKTQNKSRTNLKITCYWQWDPKGSFLVGGWIPQHMPTLLVSFYQFLQTRLAASIPVVSGYGRNISIDRIHYDVGRESLNVDYAIVNEEANPRLPITTDDADDAAPGQAGDIVSPLKDKGNATRTLDFSLATSAQWDVQLSFKSPADVGEPYAPVVNRPTSNVVPFHAQRLNFRLSHGSLPATKDIVRVSVALERTSGEGPGSRINGIPLTIIEGESSQTGHKLAEVRIFDDAASVSDRSTFSNDVSEGRSIMGLSLEDSPGPVNRAGRPRLLTTPSLMSFRGRERRTRLPVEQKHIGSMIKRNYIYFTSLLQEPEAKWTNPIESRGVAAHQLQSIDPTVVVYRAESTVVGASLWDVYAVVATWDCKAAWDKAYEDTLLLEDLGECTELWQSKTRQIWPAPARETTLLRTTYRSEKSIHVFGLTTYDRNLFPSIPTTDDVSRVRVHSELSGWALERLSPNTVQITAIEQYDNNSSMTKSSVQQALMNAVAGVRDSALKGTPPVVSRLGVGARLISSTYDIESCHSRFEYAPTLYDRTTDLTKLSVSLSPDRTAIPGTSPDVSALVGDVSSPPPPVPPRVAVETDHLECELRCEESWAAGGVELLVDPPPTRVSALRRHRLSTHGGLWLRIEHERAIAGAEGIHLSVRKAVATESTGVKGSVRVNGRPLQIESEDLSGEELQALKKQKRGVPLRLPLDQPPVATPKTRRSNIRVDLALGASPVAPVPSNWWLETPGIRQMALPVTYTMKLGTALLSSDARRPSGSAPLTGRVAAQEALDTLIRLHRLRDGESTTADDWAVSSREGGITVEKKILPNISRTAYTFRSARILEGLGAEDIYSFLTGRSRTAWDTGVQKECGLVSYGNEISLSFFASTAPSIMFRPRGFLTARSAARLLTDGSATPSSVSSSTASAGRGNLMLVASKSFDEESLVRQLDGAKYNPQGLPLGKILLEGWILEELDPYAHDRYEIPSTRVMYVSCVEYGGSMPAAYGSMLAATWPSNLRRLEGAIRLCQFIPRITFPEMGRTIIEGSSTPNPVGSAHFRDDCDMARNLIIGRLPGPDRFRMLVILGPNIGARTKSGGDLTAPIGRPDSSLPVSPLRSASGSLLDLAARLREVAALRTLLIADVALEAVSSSDSYVVTVRSTFLQGISAPTSPMKIDFGTPLSSTALPCSVSIFQTVPQLRTSESEQSGAAGSYAVRINLDFLHGPVGDPLTGESRQTQSLDDHPDLNRLRTTGALVEVLILRKRGTTPSPGANQSGPSWFCDEKPVAIKEATLAVPEKRKYPRTQLGVAGNGTDVFYTGPADMRPPLAINLAFAAQDEVVTDSPLKKSIALGLSEDSQSDPEIPPSLEDPEPLPELVRSASMYERWGLGLSRRLSRPTPPAVTKHQAEKPAGTVVSPIVTQSPATRDGKTLGITGSLPIQLGSLARPQYSALTLILIAAATFLLGSLFRGLLHVGEDFIMFGNLESGPRLSESEWSVLRKILGVRVLGWNIVLGAYRANGGT